MDRLSGIDHSGESEGRNATYAGIDNPVSVGVDERRMHVRAYNFWVSLLNGRAYPSIEDLNPDELTDFGPNSVLLDFTQGIDDPGISYIGEGLREECGLSGQISTVADVPPRSLLSRLTDHYLQIIANRAPIGFEAEFTSVRGTTMLYRGILMPFSSDDDMIDFIYGVINWKEVAVQEDALQLEVAQALSGEVAFLDAPQPIDAWADGPSSRLGTGEAVTEQSDSGQKSGSTKKNAIAAATMALDLPTDMDAADDLSEGAELADLLALARDTAEAAHGADARSRTALYGAIGRAYDFALAAQGDRESYQEILVDAGITAQERAPMTPIAKLVFGATHDRTRLAEISAALSYGQSEGVRRGEMARFIESYPGGLKALVAAQRAAKRGQVAPKEDARASVRQMETKLIVEFEAAQDEFVVFVGRRLNNGHVGIVAAIEDDAGLIDRAVRRAACSKG